MPSIAVNTKSECMVYSIQEHSVTIVSFASYISILFIYLLKPYRIIIFQFFLLLCTNYNWNRPEGARCGRDDECMKNKCEDNVCGGESLDRSSGICFRSGCGDPTTPTGDCGWDEGHAWMQDYGLVDVEKNPLESQERCDADYTNLPQQCIIGNQAGTGRCRSFEHTRTIFVLLCSFCLLPSPILFKSCRLHDLRQWLL